VTSQPYHRAIKPLPPPEAFARRVLRSVLVGLSVIVLCLGIGVVGYHAFARLPWLDSLLNASMILTGMGPVDPMTSTAAKLFASFYALFSGVAFISTIGVLLAPVLQRFLHRFHLELLADAAEDGDEAPRETARPRPGGPARGA
jgi:hypothetical protein